MTKIDIVNQPVNWTVVQLASENAKVPENQ